MHIILTFSTAIIPKNIYKQQTILFPKKYIIQLRHLEVRPHESTHGVSMCARCVRTRMLVCAQFGHYFAQLNICAPNSRSRFLVVVRRA